VKGTLSVPGGSKTIDSFQSQLISSIGTRVRIGIIEFLALLIVNVLISVTVHKMRYHAHWEELTSEGKRQILGPPSLLFGCMSLGKPFKQ